MKHILFLLITTTLASSSCVGLEAFYNGTTSQLTTNRPVERFHVGQKPIYLKPAQTTFDVVIEENKGLKLFFEEKKGFPSQINFRPSCVYAVYNNDGLFTSIRSQRIKGGYQFMVNDGSLARKILPAFGSYYVNTEGAGFKAYRFLLSAFYERSDISPDAYQLKTELHIPDHVRFRINNSMLDRALSGSDYKLIDLNPDNKSFNVTHRHGEITHVYLYDVMFLDENKIQSCLASTVSFNKTCLDGTQIKRVDGNSKSYKRECDPESRIGHEMHELLISECYQNQPDFEKKWSQKPGPKFAPKLNQKFPKKKCSDQKYLPTTSTDFRVPYTFNSFLFSTQQNNFFSGNSTNITWRGTQSSTEHMVPARELSLVPLKKEVVTSGRTKKVNFTKKTDLTKTSKKFLHTKKKEKDYFTVDEIISGYNLGETIPKYNSKKKPNIIEKTNSTQIDSCLSDCKKIIEISKNFIEINNNRSFHIEKLRNIALKGEVPPNSIFECWRTILCFVKKKNDAEGLRTFLLKNEKDLSFEQKIEGWTFVVRSNLRSQKSNINCLKKALESVGVCSAEKRVNGLCALVSRSSQESTAHQSLRTILLDPRYQVSVDARIDGWIALIKNKIHINKTNKNKDYAERLRSLLKDYSDSTENIERIIEGWRCVEFSQLDSCMNDGLTLCCLLHQYRDILPFKTLYKAAYSLSFAQKIHNMIALREIEILISIKSRFPDIFEKEKNARILFSKIKRHYFMAKKNYRFSKEYAVFDDFFKKDKDVFGLQYSKEEGNIDSPIEEGEISVSNLKRKFDKEADKEAEEELKAYKKRMKKIKK